jgi:hypothetical protein
MDANYVQVLCGGCGHAEHYGECEFGKDLTCGPCRCLIKQHPPIITYYCNSCDNLREEIARLKNNIRQHNKNFPDECYLIEE